MAEILEEELEVSAERAREISARLEFRMLSVVRESFSGPLPPPHILAKYEEISPGLLERIVGMAERQAKHRQDLERIAVGGNTWMGKAGVVAGSLLGVAALAVVSLAIVYEAPLEYFGGILAAVAGLAGIYLYARRRKVKDAEERSAAMQQLFEKTAYPRLQGTNALPESSQSSDSEGTASAHLDQSTD